MNDSDYEKEIAERSVIQEFNARQKIDTMQGHLTIMEDALDTAMNELDVYEYLYKTALIQRDIYEEYYLSNEEQFVLSETIGVTMEQWKACSDRIRAAENAVLALQKEANV